MKKHLLRISLCLLLVGLLGGGIFLLTTKGVVRMEDGVRQNSRCSIENLQFENGTVYYTLVNNTPFALRYSGSPYLQQKIDGVWTRPQYLNKENDTLNASFHVTYCFSPFSRSPGRVSVGSGLGAGEYRLCWGTISYTDYEAERPTAVYSDTHTYIVGYFSLTAADFTPQKSGTDYTADGMLQNTSVTLLATKNANVYHLQNQIGRRIQLSPANATVEIYNPTTESFEVASGLGVLRQYEDSDAPLLLLSGSSTSLRIGKLQAPDTALPSGLYRIRIPYTVEGSGYRAAKRPLPYSDPLHR